MNFGGKLRTMQSIFQKMEVTNLNENLEIIARTFLHHAGKKDSKKVLLWEGPNSLFSWISNETLIPRENVYLL